MAYADKDDFEANFYGIKLVLWKDVVSSLVSKFKTLSVGCGFTSVPFRFGQDSN